MAKRVKSVSVRLAELGLGETDERVLMRRRWLQVLVHSCLYYRLDKNLIPDQQWDQWARELYALVQKYPGIAKCMPYSKALLKFHYSTGYDLPLHEPWVVSQAQYLLNMERKKVVKIDFRGISK